MKMNEGVEWSLHTCLNLAWVGAGQAVPAMRLAAFYELPTAYLNKQLQALARAGIVVSTPGPRGGFQLARPPGRITLMDVVAAIEGADDAFRCAQILRQAPGADPEVDYRTTCVVSHAMRSAELAWRRELGERTLSDLMDDVRRQHPDVPERTRSWFVSARI